MTLASCGVGDVGQVSRVTERLENEPGMLVALEHAGLVPGTRVEVLSVAVDGAMAVRAARGVIALAASSAASILVRPGDLELASHS